MQPAQVTSMKQATISLQGLLRGVLNPELHNKLTPILNYLKSAQETLQKISNGQAYEIQAGQLGELADVVSFHQYVAADVKTYCTKYIGKYKLNHTAKFWEKARDVVQSAMEKAKREEQSNTQLKKMEKQLADKTKAEAELNKKMEGLQAQMKSDQPLNKQQEEALTKILESAIRGEVRLFKQVHASQKYSYLKGNSYEQVEYYLKQYNLNQQMLKPLLAQSMKLQQLQQKMENLINNSTVQDKTISIADKCRNHWQKIEQLYLYYKKNELNKEKVEILQEAIKSTCRGIPYEAKNNQRYENILAHEKIARVIAPVVQNHQSQKKLYDILKSMVEIDIGFVQNTKKPTIERCIEIANQLQKTINEKGQQLNKSIGDQSKLKVNTIQQLFAMIQIWKQLQQKKQQGSPSTTTTIPFNNNQRPSPSRHHPQTPTNNTTTNPNKSMNNMWASNRSSEQNIELAQIEQAKQDSLRESIRDQLQKAYEVQYLNTRNLLINEIENAGKLSWIQFIQRFDIKDRHAMVQNINNLTNKSFAEVVIRKVLISTQKSLQLLSNSVCEALTMNRNQLVIIEQLTQKSLKQEQQNKKLTKQLNELKQKTSSNQITIYDSGSSKNIHIQQQEKMKNKCCQKLETTIRQMRATMQKIQVSRNHYQLQYESQKNLRTIQKQNYTELEAKLAAAESAVQATLAKLKEQKVKWEALEAKYKQDIKQKLALIEGFRVVNLNLADYSKKKEEQNKKLSDQLSQLQQQVSQLQTKLTQKYNQSQAHQSEINEYKAAYTLLKDEVDSCIRKAEGVVVDNKDIDSVTKMYERMENALRHQLDRKQQYKGQLHKLQQQKAVELREEKAGLENRENQLRLQLAVKCRQLETALSEKEVEKMFCYEATITAPEIRFIVDQLLKANPHSRIKKINLLYKYPLMQGSNPYDRIYDHPNYVVVVKLKNGMLVAMYSQIPLSARESHGRAFIASVTNRKAFPFREDCDIEHVVAFHYSGHLIFGNEELGLGLWHPSYLRAEIHPDLRSFETMGEKGPEVFVGNVSQKKYDVTDYEIFQVEFEEEEKN